MKIKMKKDWFKLYQTKNNNSDLAKTKSTILILSFYWFCKKLRT